jgi:hypothetical protein
MKNQDKYKCPHCKKELNVIEIDPSLVIIRTNYGVNITFPDGNLKLTNDELKQIIKKLQEAGWT